MDKEPVRVRSGQNNSISERRIKYSKSSSSPPPSSNNHWNSKWASSSKFNRILGNIERSIMNQFSGANNSNSNSNHHSSSRNKVNGKTKQSANRNFKPPSSHIISNPVRSNESEKAVEQVSQKDPHQISGKTATSRITLQAKSNSIANSGNLTSGKTEKSSSSSKTDGNNKTALNKYQQQIVSTMRSNHLLVNNKLSIPPPHANDEARNQTHRILFGSSANATLTFDTNNSEQQYTSKNPQQTRLDASNNLRQSRTNVEIDHSKRVNKLETNYVVQQDALRSNSSPASSARSLPTLNTKSSGSQPLSSHIINQTKTDSSTSKDEEKESGFASYQSRRSLISATRSVQDYPSNCEHSQNKPINMIPMQMNQVPMGLPLNYSQQQMYNSAIFSPSYQQQDPHQVKQWQQQQQQQQQTINTQNYLDINHYHHQPQQQLVGVGNQVPILTADSSGNNNPLTSYPNNNPQLHQFTNNSNNTQKFNQTFSDNRQQQLYVVYCPTSFAIVPVNSLDNGQQIYANAPPKPRRYQYYDSYQTTHPIPHLATSATNSTSATSLQPAPVITVSNGNNPQLACHQPAQQLIFSNPNNNRQSLSHIHHNRQQQQQRFNTLQADYNTSYMQMQNANQGSAIKSHDPLINQASQSIHHNVSYLEPQLSHRPPLTKSKSNLDTADLMRLKLDKSTIEQQSQANALHIQSNRRPIYCSQFDINHRFPDLIQRQAPLNSIPQSNLQRSKSVSHLVPECNNSQMIGQQSQHCHNNLFVESLPIPERKFVSVSSASTNNLNYIGIVRPEIRQFQPSARVLSQISIPQQHYLGKLS